MDSFVKDIRFATKSPQHHPNSPTKLNEFSISAWYDHTTALACFICCVDLENNVRLVKIGSEGKGLKCVLHLHQPGNALEI